MTKNDLYQKMKDENIHYINHELLFTRGAIVHYNDITAIVVDDKQVKNQESENTVLMQELGHYMANAYYRTNSPSELIAELEHKADIKAWETFFPYEEIKKLMKRGLTTATRISSGIIKWKPLIWLDALIITITNIMVLIDFNTFHPFLLA